MKANIKSITIILAFLFVIISVPSVFAEDPSGYDSYVSADAQSGGNGSIDNPFNNIQEAVDKGGSIFVKNGTYSVYEDSGYEITKSIRIVGEDRNNVIIDAENNGRIFLIDSDIEVTFINITFKNGNNENDYIYDGGGAIYIRDGTTTIDNCYFDNNVANGYSTYGGAIYQGGGDLILRNSHFINNNAEYGSAVSINGYSYSTLNISNCIFEYNIASEEGGAIYSGSGKTNIDNSTFRLNKAKNGGAIYSYGSTATLNIKNSKFDSNNATSTGGALVVRNSNIILNNNNMINCSAITGNYIYYNSGKIGVTNVSFLNNISVNITKDSTLLLNATVTDDMGNPVTGGNLSFIIGGNTYSSSLNEGLATYNFTFNQTGKYIITGLYSGSNTVDYGSNIFNGTITVNSITPTNIIYVSSSRGNDDSGNGSEENPYATITKALTQNTALGGNYTVIIEEGYYYVKDYTINANVTMIGIGNVIIDGNNSRNFYISGSSAKYTKFEGLTFINSNGNAGCINTGTISGGSGNAGRYLIINNCTFINNKGSNGAVIYTTAITIITNCSFINNTATSSQAYSGVINVQDNNLTISYCNFLNNSATSSNGLNGIYAKSGVKVFADYNFWGTNTKPNNSTISSGVNVTKWVILIISSNSTEVDPGDSINFTIDFTKYTDGVNNYNLSEIMPEITIYGNSTLGSFDSNSIIINTKENMIYNALKVGYESINFNIPSNFKQYNFTVGPQYSGTVYVSNSGTDSNIGSKEAPVASISKAIEIATLEGGSKKIIILNGTYNEGNLTIGDDLEIIANGTVIITGYGYNQIFNITNGNVSLYGLTLNANSTSGAIVIRGGKLSISFSTINNKKGNLAINNSGILDVSYSILNNTIITNNNGNVSANYNWWGNNNKPTCVNVDYWVIMTINTTKVYTSEISNITIRLNTVTDGITYNNLSKTLPNDWVTLNVTNSSGTLNGTNILLENGTAIVSFIGGENSGFIKAKIDNQTFDVVVEKAVYRWFIGDKGYRTLQLAVDAANINDVIRGIGGLYIIDSEIDVGHRYMPIEPWEVNKTITITSLDSSNPVIISGDYLTRLFNIDKGSSLTLINLILANGNASTSYYDGYGGAIHVQFGGNLTIDNCIFENNTAGEAGAIQSWGILIIKNSIFRNNTATSAYAGAVQNSGYGSLIIDNSTFIHNSANTYAGAIYADSSTYPESNTTITNSKFIENEANRGGAIFLNIAPAYILNCSFIKNKAIDKGTGYIASGGAIYDHSANLILKNSEFINNTALNNGGALELANTYTTIYSGENVTTEIDWFVIDNCTLINNTAGVDGGAIFSGYDSVPYGNITNSIFENNIALSGNGGAISNYFGILSINNTRFSNNIAGENGGVIFNYGHYNFPYEYWGNITLDNCTFLNNSANNGGVVYNYNSYSKVDILNSRFNNNSALIDGGAILNYCGIVNINSSSIFSNIAGENGGAISNYGYYEFPDIYWGNIEINDCEFSKNFAKFGGTVFNGNNCSKLDITNSKFTNESANVGGAIYNNGTLNIKNNTMINCSAGLKGNYIYNNGSISNLNLSLLGNNTLKVLKDSIIQLNANLVDDRGNPITGQNISFYVNNIFIGSVESDEGSAKLNYTVTGLPNNTLSVSGLYGGIGYYPIMINNGELKISKLVTNSSINVSNGKVGKLLAISGVIVDESGNPVANARVSVSVGSMLYNVTTDSNGKWSVNFTTLKNGSYDVYASWIGNDIYEGFAKNVNFIVSKTTTKSTVNVSNGKVGKLLAISGVIVDESGNPVANARVSVSVGGKIHSVTTNNLGKWSLYYTPTKIGSILVKVSWLGNESYYGFTNNAKFSVKSPDIRLIKRVNNKAVRHGNIVYIKTLTFKNFGISGLQTLNAKILYKNFKYKLLKIYNKNIKYKYSHSKIKFKTSLQYGKIFKLKIKVYRPIK
ncbi:carboxypeptidase regulatory-like domain-containing protein [Methanobrevibacter sp.]